MRIFDQRGYGSNKGIAYNPGPAIRAAEDSWMLFLMKGQEPKTFSAAAQVFAVDDLYYLYNECVGIVPNVVRPVLSTDLNIDGSIMLTSKRATTWWKGLSYWDGQRSIAIPDRITGTGNSLTYLFGVADSNGVDRPSDPAIITLHYTNPMNFVGFAVDGNANASSSVTNLTGVFIDGVAVGNNTIKRDGWYELKTPVTAQSIEVRNGNARITPIVADVGVGDAPEATYFVLAPASLYKDLHWTGIEEIPYLISSLSYDTKEDVAVYVLGNKREQPTYTVCRDLILGALEG